MRSLRSRGCAKLWATGFLLFFCAILRADLRAPSWYDQNAVGAAPDWHYRVPINIPAGATVNSTIKVDVDFAALLAQLGVSGAFDGNSPRVVRSNGSLSTNQEFTDTVYAGATDAAGNSRGEVRFILEDAGPVTYYLYFDIAANGAKSANPQTPINGNFEFGGTGAQDPPGWSGSTSNNSFDAQIRPSENVSVTTNTTGGNLTNGSTDGTPYTGAYSYLVGARSNNEPNTVSNPAVTLTKTFTVPSSSPGNFTIRYRPEGWDSSDDGANNYDYIRIALVGSTSTEIVGPTAGNYVTFPFSPNLGLNAATNNQSGYGQYNGWDTDTRGNHRSGMSIARGSQPWFTRTVSLAGFAGQTITLRITTNHTSLYRSWFHVDDIEWSVASATLGMPEGFGVSITSPVAATVYSPGQKLLIRATVDALPSAASNPVTANVYDNAGTLVASGIKLFNDGTHGDSVANDATWTNDGSVVADPTYTFSNSAPAGSNWKVRVFAKDASASSIGASNGLVHIPTQSNSPEIQANFYNIDEQTFSVQYPVLLNTKTVSVLSDPVNGTTNPKSIPGSIETYTVRITNQGGGAVDNNTISVVDIVPANTKLFVGNIGAPGSGPVSFTDGSPSSALTYTFAALNSTTDDLEFSNDGGVTWSYNPTADTDTCDAAVTHIRVRPKGTMPGNSGGNPYFQLSFRVRVK